MLPRPTAEPAAANTNSQRLDHMPCRETSAVLASLIAPSIRLKPLGQLYLRDAHP